MQLNKHYMVCAFKIIMGWQVQTLTNGSGADLSFSSFVVFGSIKMIEPFLGFRHIKLWSWQCWLQSGSWLFQSHHFSSEVSGSGSGNTPLPAQHVLSR